MSRIGSPGVVLKQSYTIDGKTYGSLDEMPPEVRAKWKAIAPAFSSVFAGLKSAAD